MQYYSLILYTLLGMVTMSTMAFSQSLSIETLAASCEEVCDGSVMFSGLELDDGKKYYYRSHEERGFVSLSDHHLSDLCSGRYTLKQKSPESIYLGTSELEKKTDKGYVHLRKIQVDTRGLRDTEIRFTMPSALGSPGFFLKIYCSTDKGYTWTEVSSIYQLPSNKNDSGLDHTVRLPISADNRANILIDIHQLSPNRRSGIPLLDLYDLSMWGMSVDILHFDIGVRKHMEIHSVVSNEMAGGDGYIQLDVSMGQPPYSYSWAHGPTIPEARHLSSGIYIVKVIDDKGCSESAEFIILPSNDDDHTSAFTLFASTENIFIMSIEHLYRQPLTLDLIDSAGRMIKTYHINPLYENLRMNLDLSFLQRGTYIARMTGTSFEKEVNLDID